MVFCTFVYESVIYACLFYCKSIVLISFVTFTEDLYQHSTFAYHNK